MWWTEQEEVEFNDNDDDNDDGVDSREFWDYLWFDVFFISQNFVQFVKNFLLNLGMFSQEVQTPGHQRNKLKETKKIILINRLNTIIVSS